MKYAEAVKRMKYLVEFSRDWTTGTAEDLEALSVLHRAEGVMGAVESEGEVTVVGTTSLKAHKVINAVLAYKEQSQ